MITLKEKGQGRKKISKTWINRPVKKCWAGWKEMEHIPAIPKNKYNQLLLDILNMW